MTRSLDSATLTGLTQPIVPIAILVSITTTGGVLYVWNGYGNVVWAGNTYLGVGKLGKISIIEESNSVYASGATITLEGVDTSDLADALSEITIGQPVKIYFALVNNTGEFLGTPVPIFVGLSDQVSISESAESATIAIDVESKLAQLQRNREYRYTDQMQRYLHPNDAAFQYVNLLTNYLGTWGFALGDQS